MARQATLGNVPKARGMSLERVAIQLALIVLLLLLTAAAALVFLVTLGAVDPTALGEWELLQRPLGWVAATDGPDRWIAAAISFLVALVLAMLLLQRLGGGGRAGARGKAPSRYVLLADERGFVLVETASILVVAKQAAMHAPGVVDANVAIRGGASTPIRLRVDLSVHPGADIKAAGAKARDAVHDSVERLGGIDVADVTVDVHVLDADELARVLT